MEHAHANGLIYVSDAEPGIKRQKCGKGFRLLGPTVRPITAKRTLERIRKLAIPPAYTQVWICTKSAAICRPQAGTRAVASSIAIIPNGDDPRRRQILARWSSSARSCPSCAGGVKQDLALPGLPKNKVLAVIVALLDETLVRVGNEE